MLQIGGFMFSFGAFCIYRQAIDRYGNRVSLTCVVNQRAFVMPSGSRVDCITSNLSDTSLLRAA